MTARTGLSTLIEIVHGMTDSTTSDYSLGTANFWDGDHMQQVLDRHVVHVIREQLRPVEEYDSGGTVYYKRYYSTHGNYEQTTGGTAIFYVQSATGAIVGTANYSPDYAAGLVTFNANTGGSTYYLTGYSYDLNAAAADIWRTKATHVAMAYDVKTDNTSLSRSQMRQACLEMARDFQRLAPVISAYAERSDT